MSEKDKVTRLERHHDVSAFCDVFTSRYAMGHVLVDAQNKAVVATNARMLAIVPLESVAETAMVPAGLFRKVTIRSKTKKREGGAFVSKRGRRVSIADDTGVEVSQTECEQGFPQWAKVTAATPTPVVTARVDAAMLKKICEHAILCQRSLGASVAEIQIGIATDEDAVTILAKPDGGAEVAKYLLMPRKA